MKNPLVVWTRGSLDWSMDKATLSKHFDESQLISLPCIHNEFVEANFPENLQVDCALFASRHAVEACWQSPKIRKVLDRCPLIYAVGPRTAEAIKKRGWKLAAEGTGGGKELAQMVAEIHKDDVMQILLPGGFQRAGEMELYLKKKDFGVYSVNVYRTVLEVRAEQTFSRQDFEKFSAATLCFASPSSFRSYRTWSEKLFGRCLGSWVCAIGETTAKECRRTFSNVHVAREPSIEALAEVAAARSADANSTA